MRLIRHVFHQISHFLAHLLRKVDPMTLLQDIVDAALTGLAVDTDHIRIVSSSHILRIDRKVRNRPCIAFLLLSPGHSLGNGILMRA